MSRCRSGRVTRIPALAAVRDLALAKPRAVRVSLVAETHAWRWLTSTRGFSRDAALDVAS